MNEFVAKVLPLAHDVLHEGFYQLFTIDDDAATQEVVSKSGITPAKVLEVAR